MPDLDKLVTIVLVQCFFIDKIKRERETEKSTNIYLKSEKTSKIPHGGSQGAIRTKNSALSCWQCSGSEKCKTILPLRLHNIINLKPGLQNCKRQQN